MKREMDLKRHSFKDIAAGYLCEIHKMLLSIKAGNEKKGKKALKEPLTWKFGKVADGKWEFESETTGGARMKATGDFAYALRCMEGSEFLLDGSEEKDPMKKMAVETQKAVDSELAKGRNNDG